MTLTKASIDCELPFFVRRFSSDPSLMEKHHQLKFFFYAILLLESFPNVRLLVLWLLFWNDVRLWLLLLVHHLAI